jgi:hypothetical protein
MLRSDFLQQCSIADHVIYVNKRSMSTAVAAAPVPPTQPTPAVDIEARRQAIQHRAEKDRLANDLRFTSHHPIQNYKLVRSALPPVMDSPQHRTTKLCTDFAGSRREIKAAIAAIEQEQCFHQHRIKQGLVHHLSDHLSVVSHDQALAAEVIDAECQLQALEALRADPSFAELDPQAALAAQRRSAEAIRASSDDMALSLSVRERAAGTWVSKFCQGDYMEVRGAVKRADLNGRRVRLYSKTDTNGVWHVRLLGKLSNAAKLLMSPMCCWSRDRTCQASSGS